jgi:hypothetical protein
MKEGRTLAVVAAGIERQPRTMQRLRRRRRSCSPATSITGSRPTVYLRVRAQRKAEAPIAAIAAPGLVQFTTASHSKRFR